MPWLGRPDGDFILDAPSLRRIMPHLMPTRNESVVYFEQQMDLSHTLPYLERRQSEGVSINLFQVVLAAIVRTLATRPQLHRFVVGRNLYQRRKLEISFAVKKQLSDDGRMTTVKVAFDPGDTLDEAAERIRQAVSVGKGDEATTSEREMGAVTKLPRFALRLVMSGQRTLDYFNLLPASVIDNDPMYASMFVANLGSIGLEAAFHHLYEYGTVPLFAAIGRIHKAPVVTPEGIVEARNVVNVRYTFDERITDGLYCARSLESLKKMVETPSLLEQRPELSESKFPERLDAPVTAP